MSIEVEVYVTYQDILVVNEGEPLRYQQRPWSSLIVACTVDGPNTAIENKIDSVGWSLISNEDKIRVHVNITECNFNLNAILTETAEQLIPKVTFT